MPLYQITAPNGKTYRIEGPPDASDADVARAVLAQYPDAAKKPAETTVLGQVGEAFKGLVPGAVGLVESAATGASALLPEKYEKTAREKIASIAGAAKAPFAAAPGYEETVGRKLGEAIGSTAPFLLAGPLGLAGRIGAAGLGVGAGAGEARTRAEKEGATAEQRSTATALGIIPGAMEVFAPFRILSRVPEAATAQGVQLVKRALVAGGEEAAQEAASGFAQNLIAKGIYKPEQELIEGLGEQAAYGGATGAIVQGLMDLALGRRARGAQPAPGTLPGETPIERAERLAAEKAAAEKAAQQPAAPPAPTTPSAPPVVETPAPPPVGEAPTPAPGEIPAPPPVAETPAPPVEPTPPVAETPAPPLIEEPKVRKPDEPPAGGMQPADIEALGISKKQPIYRRMLGKDLENPEQRAAVLADVENYLTKGNGSEESRTKLAEFKAKIAPAEAVTPAPPPVVETAAPAVPPAEPAVEAPVGGAPAVETAPTTPPVVEAPSVPSVSTEPEAGRAGAPVAGGPAAVAAPEGVGAVEPTGVVRPDTNVAQPVGREGAAPAPVTPAPAPAPTVEAPKPTAVPEYTEADIDRAVETGLLTEEQAEVYRAELREEEAPPTAMGAAFQKQIDDIEAQMNALKKNGKAPAKKTPARAKYDELKAQLESLQTKETGDLATKLEKMGASGVVGTRGERPVIDLDAVRENLIKARAAPKMYQAVLNYIGVDADGNYLPTTYSREDAAEMAGLGRGSGANVTRVAQAMGITADVVSRFHAGQTDIIVLGKNVSEAGTGATDLQPTRGVLYEEPKKNQPGKAAGFLRDALTPDGKLDFSKLPLNSKKATKDSPAVTGLAEIYARASNYDPSRGGNLEVIKKLNEEIAARTKTDRKGMQAALDRAYRVVRAEEETAAEQETTAPETVAPDQVVTEEEAFEAPEFADATRRLSDEDVAELPQRPTPGVASLAITEAVTRGDTKRTLQAVRETPEATPLDHLVAQRFLGLGQFLGLPKVETRPADQVKGSAQYDPKTDTISIADGQEDTHTVLHETTHAFVHKLIVANEKGLRNDEGYRDLKKLYEFLNTKYPTLKNEYGMSSLTEFASEAMSNPQFQKKLGTIRYQTRPAWTRFVEAVRKLLKIGAGDSSALVEAMAGVDSLLRVGREYQTKGPAIEADVAAVITPQTEAAVEGVDVIGEKERQTLTQRIAQDLKGNPALKLRVKFTDSLAAMEDFFTNAYAGQVRTAAGRLNPMVLISRALDASRVSKAAQEQGGLGFDSGLIVATELKNTEGQNISYQGVMGRIAEAAKDRGETYEQFRTKVDTVLYGHREYNLREENKTLPPDEQVELLLSDPEIDKLEAAFQQDDFIKGVLSDLDTIRFNLLDTLVKAGRISEEQAQDYKDAIGYIPFSRIGEYENAWANATRGANRGVAALKNIRKLEGSEERKTTSVTENFSGLVDWATKEAMKNDAGLRALKDMVLMGAAFKRPNKPKTDSPGGMVTVFDDGKPVSFYVPDPAHLVTFSIADPQLSNVLKAFQRGSQVLRAGVTSLPPFAIKQVFDDIVRAYTYAGVKNNAALVKSVMLNFPKNWVNEIFKKKPADIKALEGLGIVGTFDFTQQGNLKNILEEAGAKKETLGSSIMRVMEAGAKASDLAVRQAIFNQVLKETGDKAQAESAAREIINFSRRGSSKIMGQMISIIPFFNAYARGMDKLATAAAGGIVGQTTGTARSMFYKRMGVLTAMGLAYALMMQDDDDYQNLPDHVRDTNWVLPHGKELGFTPVIPIPAELAFFFKAIPERIVRYYKLHGTQEEQAAIDVLGNLTSRGIDVFSSPNITPQVLRPFLENIANYSFFLGRPLESQAQLQLRPFERYGTGTSDAMKTVAKGLENVANTTGIEAFAVSPIKLENAIRGIFGTAAGLGLSMADMMINPGRTDRPLHQQLGSQLTGLSAVSKDPIGSRNLDAIYDLEKRVEQVNGTVNRLMERKPEDVDQFIKDNIGLYAIRGSVQAVMSNIRVLNQAAMAIDRDTSIKPDERRKQIDQLRIDQNNLAQQAMMLRKVARDIQMGR